MKWIRWPGYLFAVIVAILLLPGQFNDFFAEFPSAREKWLNARQWTGMYSSSPEGVVNLAELALSDDSDVVIDLRYHDDGHRIDGYIYSEAFLRIGLYPYVLLYGTPNILAPNKLQLEVFDFVAGKQVNLGQLKIARDGPGGLITVSSPWGCKRRIICQVVDRKLRLSPDEHLTEDDLDMRSLLERARHTLADRPP